MASAVVGDDVFGEDPTVAELQDRVAQMLGKQAGLFVTSGTQSNLCALLSHCARGDEYIAGADAHTFKYEGGGAAVLGGIAQQPVATEADGSLKLDEIVLAVKPDDPHFAQTRLLCCENTFAGQPQTAASLAERVDLAHELDLVTHLDGARLWNASIALGEPLKDLAEGFDSVSVCLSKGLGAPLGSVLVGERSFIERAHRWRKMLGGGLRQAGIAAAAGIYALDHNIERLAVDHRHANRLANGLNDLTGVTASVATNMVFATFDGLNDSLFTEEMLKRDVAVRMANGVSRLVTHIDVSEDEIDHALSVFAETLGMLHG